MSEVVVYVAPAAVASVEAQIEWGLTKVSDPKYVIIEKPPRRYGAFDREARDFVFTHMLRSMADNQDGKPDTLWVYSLSVLDEAPGEIHRLFKALLLLGIPLYSHLDKLDETTGGAEFAVRYADGLRRAKLLGKRLADQRSEKKPRITKDRKTGGRPRALDTTGLALMLSWRDEDCLSWPQIRERFAQRRVKVTEGTLRRAYAEAKGDIE